MKKLSFIISLFLILPILASCFNNGGESEDIESTPNLEQNEIFIHELNRIKDQKKENIAAGKTYTFSRDTARYYPDKGGILTDGYVGGDIDDDLSAYVGFVGKKDIDIIIDLEEVFEGVADFTAVMGIRQAEGYNIPRRVDVFISKDGESFSKAGSSLAKISDLQKDEHNFEIALQKGVDCRYVKFVFTEQTTNMILISELKVEMLTREKGDIIKIDSYYKNETMPKVTEDIYFDKSEDDYSKEQNLILGKTARVYEQMPLYEKYREDWSNSPASHSKVLTNGKLGGSALTDKEYFHLNRGYKRDFIYDLGAIGSISSYSFSGLADNGSGVFVPDHMEMFLSMDGENWYIAHSVTPASEERFFKKYDFSYELDKAYSARFVRISFVVSAFAWLDEISVFGTKDTSNATRCDELEAENLGLTEYRPAEEYTVKGIPENLGLLCSFKVSDMDRYRLTKEQLLPYVAYIDRDGKMVDTLFDGLNLSPPFGPAPSGGDFHINEEKPTNKADWEALYEEYFIDGYNIDAIEAAVSEMKEELSLDEDYKVKVSITLCGAASSQKDFGDIDDDGISENLESVEARIKAYKWAMDHIISLFDAKEYNHIELGGFYWQSEFIEVSRKDVLEVTKGAIDYAHSLGYYMIWIPYSEATGFYETNELGFDAVTMQPNYMFQNEWPFECIEVCAEISKRLGIGVELEMDPKMFDNSYGNFYYNKYLGYLEEGARLGYMHTLKMYYQDAGPGLFYNNCYSERETERLIYDYNYMYIKNRYLTDIGNIKIKEFTGSKNEKFTVQLETDKIPNFFGVKISGAAFNGAVSVDDYGMLTYIPNEDFIGADSFQISLPYSESVTMNIVIRED